MSEQPAASRVRRFDGFDASRRDPAVPEAALDRIVEALTRSRAYLPDAARAKLSELWDPDTLLAFGVLLALWAGSQFTPVGWLADAAIAAYGLYATGKNYLGLIQAAYQASQAESDEELELAAHALALAMTDTVVDAIAGLIGAAAFARLRRLLRVVRGRLLPRRFGSGGEKRLTLGDRLVGTAAGVTLERGSVELGKKKKEWQSGAGWGLGVIGGALLVGGVVSVVATARSDSK